MKYIRSQYLLTILSLLLFVFSKSTTATQSLSFPQHHHVRRAEGAPNEHKKPNEKKNEKKLEGNNGKKTVGQPGGDGDKKNTKQGTKKLAAGTNAASTSALNSGASITSVNVPTGTGGVGYGTEMGTIRTASVSNSLASATQLSAASSLSLSPVALAGLFIEGIIVFLC
ncbi:uncharacterized protein VTP21DRAFT_4584 [Calcarisporiella thermophila]|uniref:uncharacterized protein n=1 Tax=Calcarisporiella thermophila TaxID=911321 RepID=UPI0037421EAE